MLVDPLLSNVEREPRLTTKLKNDLLDLYGAREGTHETATCVVVPVQFQDDGWSCLYRALLHKYVIHLAIEKKQDVFAELTRVCANSADLVAWVCEVLERFPYVADEHGQTPEFPEPPVTYQDVNIGSPVAFTIERISDHSRAFEVDHPLYIVARMCTGNDKTQSVILGGVCQASEFKRLVVRLPVFAKGNNDFEVKLGCRKDTPYVTSEKGKADRKATTMDNGQGQKPIFIDGRRTSPTIQTGMCIVTADSDAHHMIMAVNSTPDGKSTVVTTRGVLQENETFAFVFSLQNIHFQSTWYTLDECELKADEHPNLTPHMPASDLSTEPTASIDLTGDMHMHNLLVPDPPTEPVAVIVHAEMGKLLLTDSQLTEDLIMGLTQYASNVAHITTAEGHKTVRAEVCQQLESSGHEMCMPFIEDIVVLKSCPKGTPSKFTEWIMEPDPDGSHSSAKFATYLGHMRKERTYGGQLELHAMCNLYNIQVDVWVIQNGRCTKLHNLTPQRQQQQPLETMSLLHLQEIEHYVLLLPVNNMNTVHICEEHTRPIHQIVKVHPFRLQLRNPHQTVTFNVVGVPALGDCMFWCCDIFRRMQEAQLQPTSMIHRSVRLNGKLAEMHDELKSLWNASTSVRNLRDLCGGGGRAYMETTPGDMIKMIAVRKMFGIELSPGDVFLDYTAGSGIELVTQCWQQPECIALGCESDSHIRSV